MSPLSDTQNITISVLSAAPVFTQIPEVIVADRGYTQSINITATSTNNSNLNFTVSPLADFMTLTQHGGSAILTVSPSTSDIFDTHAITVTVTDAAHLSASKDVVVIDPEQRITLHLMVLTVICSDNSVAIHGDSYTSECIGMMMTKALTPAPHTFSQKMVPHGHKPRKLLPLMVLPVIISVGLLQYMVIPY